MQINRTQELKQKAQLNSENQLIAGWLGGWNIINFRGDPSDTRFVDGVKIATKLTLPTATRSTTLDLRQSIIWAGPDDWFWISRELSAKEMCDSLKKSLEGLHCAVTDVSGGYEILRLSGKSVTEVLAQGCPLDFHETQFKTGQSAGSVFFKASIWIWKVDDAPTFELLVRTSFKKYVSLVLETVCTEYPIVNLVAV